MEDFRTQNTSSLQVVIVFTKMLSINLHELYPVVLVVDHSPLWTNAQYSTELQVSHQIHSLLWWDDETKWTKVNSQSYHFLDLLSIEMMQRYCSFRLSTALFAHGVWVQFKHLRRLPASSNLKGLIWANCRLFGQGWTWPQYVWCGWYGSFSNFGHPKRMVEFTKENYKRVTSFLKFPWVHSIYRPF